MEKPRLRIVSVFIVVTCLAIMARLPGLTERSIWFDETYSWKLIHHFSWFDMIHRIADDVHPPLDYVVNRVLTSGLSDSIIASRIVSIFWGILTAILLVGLSIADTKCSERKVLTAVWTGLFIAFQIDHVRWSQEARIYSLLCCLVVASSYLQWRIFTSKEPDKLLYISYVLLATMLLYTHNFGLFYVTAQAIFAFGLSCANWRVSKVASNDWALQLSFCSFVLYLPWLPILYGQITAVREDYWIKPVTMTELTTLLPNHFLSDYEFISLPVWLCALLSIGAVAMIIQSLVRGPLLDRYLATLIVVPVVLAVAVSLLLTPVVSARYLLPSSLLFIPLFVGMTLRVASIPIAHGLLALVLGLLVWNYIDQMNVIAKRPGMRKICEEILARDSPRQPVVVLRSYLLFEAQYYLREQLDTRKVFAIHGYGKAGFYGGGPLMRPGEVQLPDVMHEYEGPIWVIDSDAWGYGNEAELPSGWRQTNRPTIYSECLIAGWGRIRLRELTR